MPLKTKEAQAKQQREYRMKNPEKVKAYRRKYYRENKEDFQFYNRKYYEKNRERILARQKDWYDKNRRKNPPREPRDLFGEPDIPKPLGYKGKGMCVSCAYSYYNPRGLILHCSWYGRKCRPVARNCSGIRKLKETK